jgi:hypothetical protein
MLWITAIAHADEHALLQDPSFELRLSADEGGWDLFEISQFSKNHARTGSYSIFHAGFSRKVPHHPYFIGHASGAFQEFPAEPGSRWRLTGYGLTPRELEGHPAFGILQLSFFDVDGEDIGTVETSGLTTKAKTSNEVNGRSAVGEWIRLDTGIATAPEGAATVQAFTLYVDYSGKNITQGVYFDDLTLCALGDDEEESSPCGED